MEFGVDVDLHAVVPLTERDGDRWYEGIAVGSEGTVVAWGSSDAESFVEASSVGSANLRAVTARPSNWWVVGDGGLAAASGDRGQTWTPVDLGTDANLHAITEFETRLVAVGDEVVRVQVADGNWIAVSPPKDSWGRLRGLYYYNLRLYAVGLDGVIWSTTDPANAWIAESSGTNADLFALGSFYYRSNERVIAVGAGGTLLVRKDSGWDRVDSDEHTDLVGVVRAMALGADGELFEISSRGELSRIDSFPGSRAFTYVSGAPYRYEPRLIAVGDAGVAYAKDAVIVP
jgi:photosystem II stability/assembly factor-like uncharacterized protein